MTEQSTIYFPPVVRMRNLPPWLQGWNTTFKRTEKVHEECPIYECKSYTLYWCFPILTAWLVKIEGKWRLIRKCDTWVGLNEDADICGISKKGKNQSTLVGAWDGWIFNKVTENTKYFYWF
jgi:hypothetical protein